MNTLEAFLYSSLLHHFSVLFFLVNVLLLLFFVFSFRFIFLSLLLCPSPSYSWTPKYYILFHFILTSSVYSTFYMYIYLWAYCFTQYTPDLRFCSWILFQTVFSIHFLLFCGKTIFLRHFWFEAQICFWLRVIIKETKKTYDEIKCVVQ